MNFRKTSEGGVISDPKNFVADFSVPNEHFSLPNFCTSRKRATKFSETRAGGGGSEAFWKFSKNSSKMVQGSVRYDN